METSSEKDLTSFKYHSIPVSSILEVGSSKKAIGLSEKKAYPSFSLCFMPDEKLLINLSTSFSRYLAAVSHEEM